MIARVMSVSTLVLGTALAVRADIVTLENTIPSGNLFLQPPELTGAAPLFGGGVVIADGFVAPITAALYQVSVAVEYEDFPALGVTGRSDMLLTLLADNGNSPGTTIESWIVPLSPLDTSLSVVTVNSTTNALLTAGHEYWLSEAPVDSSNTGIGWGLASAGDPSIELSIAETTNGTNSGWGPTAVNIANEFSVLGSAVPEPATFWMTGFVCVAALGSRRLRRKPGVPGGDQRRAQTN